MKQITTREKIILGIGVLAALATFVYFVFLPMLQGRRSGSVSSLEEMQERLDSVEKLRDMEPLLVNLEKEMRSQSGYEEMSFERGTADSMIIKYLAQIAAQANIKDLEQLDAKADTRRKSRTGEVVDQAVLKSVVDQLYSLHVLDEMEREANAISESDSDSNPSPALSNPGTDGEEENAETVRQGDFDLSQLPPVALRFLEEQGISLEELRGNPELQEKLRREFEARFRAGRSGNSPDDGENRQMEEPNDSNKPKESNSGESAQNQEIVKSKKLMFPPIPKNIPSGVKQSLARLIKEKQGQMIGKADISKILEESRLDNEKEEERVEKRLQLYNNLVREKKNEMLLWLSKLDISRNFKKEQKAGEFSIKMVFKSQMEQLVRLLYNLQNSAKWLKVESIRVGISDRKQTTLSVELSMTATTLYD